MLRYKIATITNIALLFILQHDMLLVFLNIHVCEAVRVCIMCI